MRIKKNEVAMAYRGYRQRFIQEMVEIISTRAGCQRGRGGRGKNYSPLECLVAKFHITNDAWCRYRAGRYTPNREQWDSIYSKAKDEGLVGKKGPANFLQRCREETGLSSEEAWLNEQRREAEEYEREMLWYLEQEQQRPEQYIPPLERAEQLEREAAALLREAAEIRRMIEATCSGESGKRPSMQRYCGTLGKFVGSRLSASCDITTESQLR